MTASPADRQRLKRQRRARAGMVKVECWLSAEQAAWVREYARTKGMTVSTAVSSLVRIETIPVSISLGS